MNGRKVRELRRQRQHDAFDAASEQTQRAQEFATVIMEAIGQRDPERELAVPRFIPSWMPHVLYADCPHLGSEPQPVLAFIERPDAVICWQCASPDAFGEFARDPDLCEYCKRPAPEHIFRAINIRLGPVTFIGNVSNPCWDKGEVTGISSGYPLDEPWPMTVYPNHARGQATGTTP